MRYLVLILTTLLCACASEAVKPMVIGYGMPRISAWENDSGTLVNPELLTDGHVTAQAQMTFPFGIGNAIDSFVTLAPVVADDADWVFGALVIRNIGVAAGTKIVVNYTSTSSNTLRTVANDRGEVCAFLVLPQNLAHPNPEQFTIEVYYNDIDGVFVQYPTTSFGIGEIWFGQTASFDVSLSVRQTYLNNAKIRYSAGGQQWPLLKPVVRQVSVDFTPQDFTAALNNTASLDGIDINTLISRLSDSRTLFISPFSSIPFNGKVAPNEPRDQVLADTAFLGHMTTAPTLNSLEKYWKTHLDFGETL